MTDQTKSQATFVKAAFGAKNRNRLIDEYFSLQGLDELSAEAAWKHVSNNWVGRLARLYAEQSTTAAEAWLLVEWMVHYLPWRSCWRPPTLTTAARPAASR